MKHRLGIRLDEKRLKKIQLRAKSFRLDVSEYIRRLIDNDLAQQLQSPSALNILERSYTHTTEPDEALRLGVLSSIESLLLIRHLVADKAVIEKVTFLAQQYLEELEKA